MLNKNWKNEAKRILQSELARRGIKYKELSSRLNAIGIQETSEALNAKINRGTFSFIFVLQCMAAMDMSRLNTDLDSKKSN